MIEAARLTRDCRALVTRLEDDLRERVGDVAELDERLKK